MQKFIFILIPISAYFVSGTTKFIINYFKKRSVAFKLIGDGGFPSTHTTIVSSMTSYIALSEGFNSPFFGIIFTLLLIVIFDAIGIRKRVGEHAKVLNEKLLSENKLRESSGHKLFEIIGGLLIGILIGYLFSLM